MRKLKLCQSMYFCYQTIFSCMCHLRFRLYSLRHRRRISITRITRISIWKEFSELNSVFTKSTPNSISRKIRKKEYDSSTLEWDLFFILLFWLWEFRQPTDFSFFAIFLTLPMGRIWSPRLQSFVNECSRSTFQSNNQSPYPSINVKSRILISYMLR